MLICGVKVTHDSAVALIDSGRLAFAVELEKRAGNPRYVEMQDTADIGRILRDFGYRAGDVDLFVIDGWGAIEPDREGDVARSVRLGVADQGQAYHLDVARYRELAPRHDVLELLPFHNLRIEGAAFSYVSSVHTAGHVFSAYATSPFAQRKESALVLVWDGGVHPLLYMVDPATRRAHCVDALFKLFGNAYASFARRFPPFHDANEHGLSTAGKVMAYIAQGEPRAAIVRELKRLVRERNSFGYDFPKKLARIIDEKFAGHDFQPADFMASFHAYLEGLICATLAETLRKHPELPRRLCISGGCALNIKWNSAIRSSGLFEAVYVPPFPNDCGNALGAAALAHFVYAKTPALDWSVYSGPVLADEGVPPGWTSAPCAISELAALLDQTQQPVVVLQGRAELGPRALGARSMLASPKHGAMTTLLNHIKGREQYRPVAPICLEERAKEIFDPGTPDPFMLFDHRIRDTWRARAPAVVHIDGTARLQTVAARDNALIHALLLEHEKVAGLPLLCNTSANGQGRGFFPSVKAAADWGRVNYIWSEGMLHEAKTKRTLPAL